ncbi:uncharacterized protein B0T15DRAFT_528554 [Chaetomium strumarium]|uniref:Uncharacterized protein n=1 Tax=Chaetomium strumarium TaxID=1170767 RepID=A0AAJ0GVF9_9PEZI|nr:hypothetical protein B0T15DRAFT_528554 [Chaetomium strumarium]
MAAIQEQRPDIPTLTAALETTAQEIRRLPNLRVLQNKEVLGAMEALNGRMADLRTGMQTLQVQMVNLHASISSLSHTQSNHQVSLLNGNSMANDMNRPLMPLRNVRDGSIIPHFPRTAPELMALDGHALDVILDSLGMPVAENQTLASKKEFIKREWALG